MTKLCKRGKEAAKRKFDVYPSAYANAYASKICAGKIKDPKANEKAAEARDRMVKVSTGKSADKKGSSYHRSKYPDLYDEQGNLIEQE